MTPSRFGERCDSDNSAPSGENRTFRLPYCGAGGEDVVNDEKVLAVQTTTRGERILFVENPVGESEADLVSRFSLLTQHVARHDSFLSEEQTDRAEATSAPRSR